MANLISGVFSILTNGLLYDSANLVITGATTIGVGEYSIKPSFGTKLTPETNQYVNKFSQSSEQNLMLDLVQEFISMNGINAVYLPRVLQTGPNIFQEDPLSSFSSSFQLPMYIASVDGYEGQGEFFSKFGLQVEQQVSLAISKKDFETQVYAVTSKRPEAGDLIYFPFNSRLFEITFLEYQTPFFQFGVETVWNVKCEQFNYSNETIDTGFSEIDDIEKAYNYTIQIDVEVGGTGDFEVDETVVFSSSNANAQVTSWNASDLELRIRNVTGNVIASGIVTGITSGAVWNVEFVDNMTMENNITSQNNVFEDVSETLESWDKTNPFGRF